jgi:hypothetical protein
MNDKLTILTAPYAEIRSGIPNNHNGKQKLGCILFINGKHSYVLRSWDEYV